MRGKKKVLLLKYVFSTAYLVATINNSAIAGGDPEPFEVPEKKKEKMRKQSRRKYKTAKRSVTFDAAAQQRAKKTTFFSTFSVPSSTNFHTHTHTGKKKNSSAPSKEFR